MLTIAQGLADRTRNLANKLGKDLSIRVFRVGASKGFQVGGTTWTPVFISSAGLQTSSAVREKLVFDLEAGVHLPWKMTIENIGVFLKPGGTRTPSTDQMRVSIFRVNHNDLTLAPQIGSTLLAANNSNSQVVQTGTVSIPLNGSTNGSDAQRIQIEVESGVTGGGASNDIVHDVFVEASVIDVF